MCRRDRRDLHAALEAGQGGYRLGLAHFSGPVIGNSRRSGVRRSSGVDWSGCAEIEGVTGVTGGLPVLGYTDAGRRPNQNESFDAEKPARGR